jgi:hypothetical protein
MDPETFVEHNPYIKIRKIKGATGSKYTEEEKKERRRESNLKTYYNNHEYYKLYNRLNKQEIAKQKKEQQ